MNHGVTSSGAVRRLSPSFSPGIECGRSIGDVRWCRRRRRLDLGLLVVVNVRVGRVIAYGRGVRLFARPQSMRRMPQQSWKHWRPARQLRSGRALGRLSHYVWRSVDPISSAQASYTSHPGVRCATPARQPSARWRGWSGRRGEAATPRQPKRFSASSTPIAMAEARGTNSPKNGDGPLRKTGSQSSLIWKAPSSATPPQESGEDHRTVRVHVWLAKPELHAPHHARAGPGHPYGAGTGDRRRRPRSHVRRAGHVRSGDRRSNSFVGTTRSPNRVINEPNTTTVSTHSPAGSATWTMSFDRDGRSGRQERRQLAWRPWAATRAGSGDAHREHPDTASRSPRG